MKHSMKHTWSYMIGFAVLAGLMACGGDDTPIQQTEEDVLESQQTPIKALRDVEVTEEYLNSLTTRKKALLEVALIESDRVIIENDVSSVGCSLEKCYFEVDENDKISATFKITERRTLIVSGNTSCQYVHPNSSYTLSDETCYDVAINGYSKIIAAFYK